MKNYDQTIISQYKNSPRISALISAFNSAVEPSELFDSFYDNIWDVDTATGIGLDIWGRIVGVSRVLKLSTSTYFGFKDGVNDYMPFNVAPFWTGTPSTNNYTLSDDAYRALILLKAAANICNCGLQAFNQLLTSLYAGRGRVYVNDYDNMSMRITFEFYLQPYEWAILTGSGVIPRPTGVLLTIIEAPAGTSFGFAEAGAGSAPFNQGTFLPNGATNAS
jgi:hypothetical protein